MENWREYLEELENTSEVSMPTKFYISVAFGKGYKQVMTDLAQGMVVKHENSFTGIVGFADHPSNFMHFHGTQRDATIVMPAEDFLELNDSVVKD